MRWLVLVFAMRLAACTPPAVKAEAKSSATFTIETLDLEDGAVSVELPVFHFDDPAVNAALAAIVARDVEREK
ncbi:MAG TPA: hypothetical protein VIF62_00125, partial [Labilithrix sp.]